MGEYKKIADLSGKEQLPLVCICSITYNHAPYIRQCLDGFLMQKTNFKYEIIIHDDCSTDGTTEIIKEYAEKYPDIIFPIYQTENQYSKGVRGMFAKFVFPKAKGKYIAMCEGDDYWTDPLKLQKQVDFLEANQEYTMCSHLCEFYDQKQGKYLYLYPTFKEGETNILRLEDYIRGGNITQTATLVFRNKESIRLRINQARYCPDIVLYYILLNEGLGFCILDNMSLYRVHSGGVWSMLNNVNRILWEFDMKLSIYDVYKDKNAALFLLLQFVRPIPRSLILKELPLFSKVCSLFARHFGMCFTFKMLFSKLFLNKNLSLDHPIFNKSIC